MGRERYRGGTRSTTRVPPPCGMAGKSALQNSTCERSRSHNTGNRWEGSSQRSVGVARTTLLPRVPLPSAMSPPSLSGPRSPPSEARHSKAQQGTARTRPRNVGRPGERRMGGAAGRATDSPRKWIPSALLCADVRGRATRQSSGSPATACHGPPRPAVPAVALDGPPTAPSLDATHDKVGGSRSHRRAAEPTRDRHRAHCGALRRTVAP